MLELLLAGGVMVGMGMSGGVGEQPKPAPLVMAYVERGPLHLEGWASTVKKLETGQGYLLRGSLSLYNAGLTVSHRQAGQWQKTVLWGHLGLRKGILRVVGEVALVSPNDEVKLEAQVRLSPWLEARAWAENYAQTNGKGPRGNGGGVEMLLGWTRP